VSGKFRERERPLGTFLLFRAAGYNGIPFLFYVELSFAGNVQMKKPISARLAGNILLVALGFVLVFDILVLLSVIPADIVWGGRIQLALCALRLAIET
jgi:hypothetical protein